MREEGARRALGIVMAPHQSYASWDQYQENVAEARARVGPDVNEVVRRLAGTGARHVVAVPVGFVSDHIEVLYDLDTEARETAARAGAAFHRAGTVMDHPAFIRMLGDLVAAGARAGQRGP
jgi:protoheme ferro-lyase